MASGKPIVCSDIEGYRQVAEGTSAVLVPPSNAPALEAALANLVQVDPAILARQGSLNRRVAESYEWDRLAVLVRAEYLAAIAARGQ